MNPEIDGDRGLWDEMRVTRDQILEDLNVKLRMSDFILKASILPK